MPHRRPTLNPTRLALAALALAVAFAAPPAAAQMGGMDDVGDIITRTDEILQEIAPLIQECDSEQARRIFEDALQKQQQAHHLHGQGRHQFARRVSMHAREAARVAERLARESLVDHDRLRHHLDRLVELWEQARDRAQETGNGQAMRFVQEAEALYHRAREQYRQTRYAQARALLQQAEAQLNRAVRILFESGDAERLEHEIDRTAELIARARDRLSDVNDPALGDLLGRAEETLGRARRALTEDRPLMALRFARQAREQAQRVLRQLGPAPDAEGVRAQLERFDEQHDRVAEQVRASGDPDAAQLLVRAREMRDQAQQALEQGRLEQALRRIRTALNLQRQAAERVR